MNGDLVYAGALLASGLASGFASGLFGIGVNDEDTIASNLQKLMGNSHRVVNAGVGGYGGEQAYNVARMLPEKGKKKSEKHKKIKER